MIIEIVLKIKYHIQHQKLFIKFVEFVKLSIKEKVNFISIQNADGYNFKSDVYSLGTVACELANGSNTYIDMPFGNLSVRKDLFINVQFQLEVSPSNSF